MRIAAVARAGGANLIGDEYALHTSGTVLSPHIPISRTNGTDLSRDKASLLCD
jgi:hypothetical protein